MNLSRLFRGRINRRNWAIGLVSTIISIFLSAAFINTVGTDSLLGLILGLSFILLMIISIIINLSLHIRRLHDLGASGWWFILVYIFSIFGFLYLGLIEGEKKENRYGKVPPADIIFPNQILGLGT